MGQNDPNTRKTEQNPPSQQPQGRQADGAQDKSKGSNQGYRPEVPGRPDADKNRDRAPVTGPGGGRVDDTERRNNDTGQEDDTEPMKTGAGKPQQSQDSSKRGR